MAIDAGAITTFVDETANDPDELNTTITEITETIDAHLETATGHSHDGTDSRSVSSGVGGLSNLEAVVARISGGFA